jgi:hypothetical protein
LSCSSDRNYKRNPETQGASAPVNAYGKSTYQRSKTTYVSYCYFNNVTGYVIRVSRSTQAVRWLRRKPAFDPRPSRMKFIVGQVVFSEYFGFAPISNDPLLFHTHSSLNYQRRYMILAYDSRVTTQKSEDIIYTAAKACDHYIHTLRKIQTFHPMYHNT